MGPDEFATREELGLVITLLLAEIRYQEELITGLTELLRSKGIVDPDEISVSLEASKTSERAAKLKERWNKIKGYWRIRKTLARYEDPELDPDS